MKENKLVIVIGAFGSGKSEYAINLAKNYNDAGEKVVLCDLDVVNPYFRSRDVCDEFEKIGIQVVAPEGEYKHADLPMISARVSGSIKSLNKTVILDVGGNPEGARTLGRFVPEINARGYEMHYVVNTRRPFTSNESGIDKMRDMIQLMSKLQVTEIVCNTNLMEYTDENVVKEGVEIVNNYAIKNDITFDKYLVLDKYEDKVSNNILGKQRVILTYFLKKPWEEKMVYRGI